MKKNFYSHTVRDLESGLFVVLLVALSLTAIGCQVFSKKPASEASLDAELSKTTPPSAPIPMANGEPQKGFEQEPAGTTNS